MGEAWIEAQIDVEVVCFLSDAHLRGLKENKAADYDRVRKRDIQNEWMPYVRRVEGERSGGPSRYLPSHLWNVQPKILQDRDRAGKAGTVNGRERLRLNIHRWCSILANDL